MKKLGQGGLIPLLILVLLVVLTIIVLAYLRVSNSVR